MIARSRYAVRGHPLAAPDERLHLVVDVLGPRVVRVEELDRREDADDASLAAQLVGEPEDLFRDGQRQQRLGAVVRRVLRVPVVVVALEVERQLVAPVPGLHGVRVLVFILLLLFLLLLLFRVPARSTRYFPRRRPAAAPRPRRGHSVRRRRRPS